MYPPFDGPTHRYLGASAACWAVFNYSVISGDSDFERLISRSRIPDIVAPIPSANEGAFDSVFGDAYAVQHHGEDSPQAIQSVAGHLLNIHGMISGQTTKPGWALARALRIRGVFHKLEPPPLGTALTIRHLFPGVGVVAPVTRTQYVVSVYETWMSLHRFTVEQWYDRYVIPDRSEGDSA